MKWMLVVMVLGTAPLKTEMLFDTIDQCFAAEEQMRAAYTEAYNRWSAWAGANPAESGWPNSRAFQEGRMGLRNAATCIPHKDRLTNFN